LTEVPVKDSHRRINSEQAFLIRFLVDSFCVIIAKFSEEQCHFSAPFDHGIDSEALSLFSFDGSHALCLTDWAVITSPGSRTAAQLIKSQFLCQLNQPGI
jgi:hypothetical protein